MTHRVVPPCEQSGAEERQGDSEHPEPGRTTGVEGEHRATHDDQRRAGEDRRVECLAEQGDGEEHGERAAPCR